VKLAAGLARRVQRWQRLHGRHGLPWQGTRDPYRVWLSEVMLQQTQVATVLPYYALFLQRFPDVQALAQAPLDDVLALWSGLGYYSRARNLHRCAQVVVQQHAGQFPDQLESLERLPGIGRSTAAAIAVFCFGRREAILDGNVKRVLSRALAFDGDLAKAPAVQQLWAHAQALLPRSDLVSYTQGLMDLGASVCSLRRPDCAACPLQGLCLAEAAGQQQAYPVKGRRALRGRRSHALLWLQWRGRWLLVQRPARGVWAGLWSLPEFDSGDALNALTAAWPGRGQWLPTIEHALTHFDWSLAPLHWQWPARGAAPAGDWLAPHSRWVLPEEALALGLAAPVRRLLQSQPTMTFLSRR
jgi:A/G-specific adenine glycosylase